MEANGNIAAIGWTTDKPRTQGYYWLRLTKADRNWELVSVKADTSTWQLYVSEHGEKRRYKLHDYANNCEWYGPIVPPTA